MAVWNKKFKVLVWLLPRTQRQSLHEDSVVKYPVSQTRSHQLIPLQPTFILKVNGQNIT